MADYNAGARYVTRIPSAISRLLQLRTQNSRMFWLVAAEIPADLYPSRSRSRARDRSWYPGRELLHKVP
jgi:hypothetical protein